MVILVGEKNSEEQTKLAAEDWRSELNHNFDAEYLKIAKYLNSICQLLIDNNEKLARVLSNYTLKNFSHIPGKIGKSTLVEHLEKIVNLDGGRMQAAERAMTASIILAR
ncbi:MAG: hypothetical protein Q8L51_03810 [Candidatus Amesbacteria bacterium]|nr:hypothetical protein [Candidatus Amesbacteria bacterium]